MENQFSFLASYTYSYEANVYKSLLESRGLEVFMRDHHTIDSDPLVSNAIGGVKLFVRTEDLEKAREILSEVAPFSVDAEGKP